MKKSIPLIIDSSILKQMPKLNNELMKELVKCIQSEIFSLYVPEIIENEFITWLQKEIQEAFNSVDKANESLNKYYEEPSILGIKLQFGNISTQITHRHMSDILQKAVKNWYEFKKSTSAIDLPIKEDHGKIVMDAYFKGDKPFSGVKSRNDIPDAFIYCCLIDLIRDNDKVIFITQDKKLTKTIASERFNCFDSISALLSDGKYKVDDEFLKSLKEDDLLFTLIKINQEYIHQQSKFKIEYSDPVMVMEEEILENVIGNSGRITTTAKELSIDINNIRKISELSALIRFRTRLEHTATSLASSAELSLIGEDRLQKLERSGNEDGEVEIVEKYNSFAEGNFSVTFDNAQPSSWSFKESFFNFLSEIKEISIAVEDIKVIKN